MKGRRKFLSQGWLAFGLIVILIVIDQIIKIEVKTGMYLRESIHIADWFQILFIENNGMAYGMTFINKVVLTLFRVVVVSVIGYYIWKVLKEKVRTGYLVCLSMIFAGAIGNIFDCLFYGLIFSESTPFSVSTLVPFGEGYAPFLQGRVVDMFYFPIIDTNLPDWLPIWGGEHFIFFSPVFNFADSCISVGVVALLLFYRKELSQISLFNHKDEKSMQAVLDYIVKEQPLMTSIIFDCPDHPGHDTGWMSAEYMEALTEMDGVLKRIYEAVERAGMADETLFVLTADHGGKDKGHGGISMEEMETCLVFCGKGVRPGTVITETSNVTDVPATLAHMLGLQRPHAWIGRPLPSVVGRKK